MKALNPSVTSDVDTWSALFAGGMLPPAPSRRLAEHCAKEFPPEASVLFAGCGAGQMVELLSSRRPDLRWTLIDYSPQALARAKQRLQAFGGATVDNYLLGDIEKPWPWTDKAFDVVLLCDVLEYVESPGIPIAEGKRVAGKLLAVSMEMSAIRDDSKADEKARWAFHPIDPWQVLGGNIRVHHLNGVMLALVKL